jgi:SAM-dependent methyltransferase
VDTDTEWKKWGERDPYFAVLTDPKFRSANLSDESRREFFDSGRLHVNHVLDACQRYVNPHFSRGSVLDFGCGTGRLALPFAEQFEHVTAVDVSQAMLREARRNAEVAGLKNIAWLPSDDNLSAVQGRFDLVHSVITLQHVDVPRGRALFARLVELVAEGGVGAIQITYGKAGLHSTFGTLPENMRIPPPPPSRDGEDPVMLMSMHSLSELAFLMQSHGIGHFSADFTEHDGSLGVFLYFGKPGVRT